MPSSSPATRSKSKSSPVVPTAPAFSAPNGYAGYSSSSDTTGETAIMMTRRELSTGTGTRRKNIEDADELLEKGDRYDEGSSAADDKLAMQGDAPLTLRDKKALTLLVVLCTLLESCWSPEGRTV